MVKQMIGIWIAIPILMTAIFLLGVFLDFTYTLVEEHYYEVAIAVFVMSYAGLRLSIGKLNDTSK
jgi:uncharacterized protein involved in exopolysaccharide biosynthesis